MKTITWTKDLLDQFIEAYDRAIENKMTEFEFKNDEYLVTYARYLIEYLKSKLR